MKFQATTVEGKPKIYFEAGPSKQHQSAGSDKRRYDYKTRDQRFTLRDAPNSTAFLDNSAGACHLRSLGVHRPGRRSSSADYRGSEISYQRSAPPGMRATATRGAPPPGRGRVNRNPGGRGDQDETVTLTQAQLSALLAAASSKKSSGNKGYTGGGDSDSALGADSDRYDSELDGFHHSDDDHRQQKRGPERGGRQEKAQPGRQPQQKPPPWNAKPREYPQETTHIGLPKKSRRPPAENVLGLLAKLDRQEKDNKKAERDKAKPPPGRAPKPPKRNANGHFDDEDDGLRSGPIAKTQGPGSRRRKEVTPPRNRGSREEDTRGSRGREERRGGGGDVDPDVDAVMQRVIEENRGKMSEEDLVDLLSKVYVELKKNSGSPDDKPARQSRREERRSRYSDEEPELHLGNGTDEDGDGIGELPGKSILQQNQQPRPMSIMEKKKEQWAKEKEEMAAIANTIPWAQVPCMRSSSRVIANDTAGYIGGGGGGAPLSAGDHRRSSRLNRYDDSGDNFIETGLGFGVSREEMRKKESDRKQWLEDLNVQRQERHVSNNRRVQETRASEAPNNASAIRDRPF